MCPRVEPPSRARLGEVVWLEPFPDALLEGAIDVPHGPLGPLRSRPKPSPWPSSPPFRSCRLASSPFSSCGMSSDSTRTRRPRCWTRVSNRSRAPSSGPAPACSAGCRPLPAANRLPLPGSATERADRGELRHRVGVRRISTRWSLFSPDDVFISMPPVAFEYEAGRRGSLLREKISGRAGGSTSCQRAKPTASRRSESTCAPRAASVTASDCPSPSPAAGSAQ